MNKELSYKIYKAVEVSIASKTGMDGLIELLDSILYYELKAFADEITVREKLDTALMSYAARHSYRQGYAKRQKEIHATILKALKARRPEKLEKSAQLPQNTEELPHSPSVNTGGGGEVIEPSDNIT